MLVEKRKHMNAKLRRSVMFFVLPAIEHRLNTGCVRQPADHRSAILFSREKELSWKENLSATDKPLSWN
jgi:hypothetical protein